MVVQKPHIWADSGSNALQIHCHHAFQWAAPTPHQTKILLTRIHTHKIINITAHYCTYLWFHINYKGIANHHVRLILISLYYTIISDFRIDIPGAKSVLPKKRTIPCFWPATNTWSPTSTLTPSGSKLTPGKDFFLGAGGEANQMWNSDDKLQIYTSLLCTPRLLIFNQKCSTNCNIVKYYYNLK